MNFTRNELEKKRRVEFNESIDFNQDTFVNMSLLRNLVDIEVVGDGYFDVTYNKFYTKATITGIMVVPCAISNVDVDYPFTSEMKITYAFDTAGDDEILVKGPTVHLLPEILQTIIMDVPIKVVSKDAKYKSGENWEVVSEEQLKSEDKPIDPRLAKLKEFKFSDD